MTVTYDLSTNIGLVRLRIGDSTGVIFSDEEITAMITLEGSTLLGTAMALETMATNQLLLLKVIKVLGLSTDGSKVAAELRLQAKALRDQAVLIDEASGGLWDIAETIEEPFGYREKLEKDILRNVAS